MRSPGHFLQMKIVPRNDRNYQLELPNQKKKKNK